MRTRTATNSVDIGVLAAMAVLGLGLWIALSVVISGRVSAPSFPNTAPQPETPTTQPAPTSAAPGPANTNEGPPTTPVAPDPAQGGSGTQPAGPGLVDPAQADPYPPKPRFDEPIDQPITNVKPIYIGEGR